MNIRLESFKNEIKTKKVAVLGIGVSNKPLVKYLAGIGTSITAFDRSEEKALESTLKEFEGMDVEFSLGENYLEKLNGFDVIFKTPVVRADIPELVREKERGAVITSEMEVFCELCPARIFAVTGSDGKTTTTTLIYRILTEQGYNCWLGGNIGTPLLSRIDDISDSDMVVLELSSFQLHTMKNRINTAVVTNVSPNHLDVHKSMEEYIEAKKNIFLYQTAEDTAVLNYDNIITRSFGGETRGKVIYFSRQEELDSGICIIDGKIIFKDEGRVQSILDTDDILLPGVHNVENYMAAAAATLGFIQPEPVRRIASTFGGVEHRNEFIREYKGIRFYNDSIGSSPTRTIATVKAFRQKVILISGGYDKHIPYDIMGEALSDRVKCLVLLGQTTPLIEKSFMDEAERNGRKLEIPVIKCFQMEDAVGAAFRNACEGDIILLSPASASFDLYKNFEERGNIFKHIVNSLS